MAQALLGARVERGCTGRLGLCTGGREGTARIGQLRGHRLRRRLQRKTKKGMLVDICRRRNGGLYLEEVSCQGVESDT